MSHPTITPYDAPGGARAVILMLHGGRPHSSVRVDWRSTSWHRSRAMQRAIAPRAGGHGVSTWLLRYRQRGWNDAAAPSPVADARWALDRVRTVAGDVPVILLGHSMGARAAVHVADHPQVVGVVALAPWFAHGDSVTPLAGRHLAAAHGSSDGITSPEATRELLHRASEVAASTQFHPMGAVGHYMLRRVPEWNRFALSRALGMLECDPAG